MKAKIRIVVLLGVLTAIPMTAHAVILGVIGGIIDGIAQTVYRGVKQANATDVGRSDLATRQNESTMTPEERQARDEVIKQTFDDLSAHLPENEREAEIERLQERYMALAPRHPSVTERLDILRDEAAAKKTGDAPTDGAKPPTPL